MRWALAAAYLWRGLGLGLGRGLEDRWRTASSISALSSAFTSILLGFLLSILLPLDQSFLVRFRLVTAATSPRLCVRVVIRPTRNKSTTKPISDLSPVSNRAPTLSLRFELIARLYKHTTTVAVGTLPLHQTPSHSCSSPLSLRSKVSPCFNLSVPIRFCRSTTGPHLRCHHLPSEVVAMASDLVVVTNPAIIQVAIQATPNPGSFLLLSSPPLLSFRMDTDVAMDPVIEKRERMDGFGATHNKAFIFHVQMLRVMWTWHSIKYMNALHA
ncbi:hypothetical protein MUK42_37083 [Musa troglodytarum]|uniref:Uncharacterized protein n=1 Tax=Musa troglodytarum TaxID=320322 RepID=A0A9E7J901_9LILI|nr:hypothetical protein MUK42_37083 [Musa troglodytarum]